MPTTVGENRASGPASETELLEARICPRCHQPFSYITVKRGYVYAVHVVKVEGKWKKKYCYLGPEGSYKYVTKTHESEGLMFFGLKVRGRALLYAHMLSRYLELNANEVVRSAHRSTVESTIRALREAADALERALKGGREA
jgi:hypothetical protein